jgi:hypothetical protein
MELVSGGYFPKRTIRRPDWLTAAVVEEVCSVSTCMSPGPENWVDVWRHNELGWYDSAELAWAVVPEDAVGFEVFAYALAPVVFVAGEQRPLALPELAVAMRPSAYEVVGFDAVSKSDSDFFECSPLSCNNMAGEVPVNRYCLVNTASEAVAAARRFSLDQPEPGNYYVIQVWRAARGGPPNTRLQRTEGSADASALGR